MVFSFLKRSDKVDKGRRIWDKQKTIFTFEVLYYLSFTYILIDTRQKKISWNTLKENPEKIPVSEANSKAAQILAEMFGMVCHSEYYQQQMIFIIYSSDNWYKRLLYILQD